MGANVSADSTPLKWSELLLYSDGCPTSPSGSPSGASHHQLYNGAESNVKLWSVGGSKYYDGSGRPPALEGINLTTESAVSIDPRSCYIVLYLTRRGVGHTAATPPSAPLPSTPPSRSVPASFISAYRALKETVTPRGMSHPFSLDELFPQGPQSSSPFAKGGSPGVNAVVYVLSGQQATGLLKANALISGMQLQGWLTEHPHLPFGLYTACSKVGIATRFYNSQNTRRPLSAERRGTPRNSGSALNSPVSQKQETVPHLLTSLMGEDMSSGLRLSVGGGTTALPRAFDKSMFEPGFLPTSPTDYDQIPFDDCSDDTPMLHASGGLYGRTTNAGRQDSEEVVQAFVQPPGLSIPGRPAFERIEVKRARSAEEGDEETYDIYDERVMEQRARDKLMRWSPLCSTVLPFLAVSGEGPANDLETLLESQVTHVLNTVNMIVDNMFPEHFTYFPINMMDSVNEDISVLFPHTISCIEGVKASQGKLLIHCQQGASRSCTLILCYLMWDRNLSVEQALQYLRERRGIAKPNLGFTARLSAWEERLRSPDAFEVYELRPFSMNSPDVLVWSKTAMKREPSSASSAGAAEQATYFDQRTCYLMLDRSPSSSREMAVGSVGSDDDSKDDDDDDDSKASSYDEFADANREPRITLWEGSKCAASCASFAKAHAADVIKYSFSRDHGWGADAMQQMQVIKEGSDSEYMTTLWRSLGLDPPASDTDNELLQVLTTPLSSDRVESEYWSLGEVEIEKKKVRDRDLMALKTGRCGGGFGGATPRLIGQVVSFMELLVRSVDGFESDPLHPDLPFEDDDDFEAFRENHAFNTCVLIKHKADQKIIDVWAGSEVFSPEGGHKATCDEIVDSFGEWLKAAPLAPDWLRDMPMQSFSVNYVHDEHDEDADIAFYSRWVRQ